MGKLSKDYRINAFSTPAVLARMGEAVNRIALAGRVKFRDRKFADTHLINAAVMAFCDLPPDQQEAVLKSQLAELEAILERQPDPAPGGTPGEGRPKTKIGVPLPAESPGRAGKRRA